MKIYLIVCLLVSASALDKEVLKAQWESYKAQYRKEYDPSVEADHLKNFIQSSITIEEHNARYHRGEVKYELGHNKFSDLSHEDMEQRFFGRKKINIGGYYNFTEMPPMATARTPNAINWRDKVTKVKDQGQCGSCYAFACVALVEAAFLRKFSLRLDLSEQQIIDCTYKVEGPFNNGCGGGHEFTTLTYISIYGLNLELEYLYTSGMTRRSDRCRKGKYFGDWGKGLEIHRIPKHNEEELAPYLVANGPLLVSMSANNDHLKHYRSGIFDYAACKKRVDHTVLLVGYGTEGGNSYWLIKNSFGKEWGDNGYVKLLRGYNQCGIVTDFSYFVDIKAVP